MRALAAAALLIALAGVARAADAAESLPLPVTERERFLAIAISAMMACALASFFLSSRISERTHVALALLVVLIGGFCLFALFGLAGAEHPVISVLVILGLIGMFKLMNQFEIRRKSSGPPGRN